MSSQQPDPNRFQVSPSILRIDSFMERFIRIGGFGIIAAVFCIFIFIAWQVFPLFQGAEVTPEQSFSAPAEDALIVGIDEWSELPFVLTDKGNLSFIRTGDTPKADTPEAKQLLPEGAQLSAFRYKQKEQILALGTEGGKIAVAQVSYKPSFDDAGNRTITSKVSLEKTLSAPVAGAPLLEIDFDEEEANRLIGVIQENNGQREAHLLTYRRKKTMLGTSKLKKTGSINLTALGATQPSKILTDAWSERVIVADADGRLSVFNKKDGEYELVQEITPFDTSSKQTLVNIDYLLGKNSVCLTSSKGINYIYSIARNPESGELELAKTKTLTPLKEAPDVFATSLRNRSYLLTQGNFASLRYSTTESIRWEKQLPFTVKDAVISGKHDKILFLDTEAKLHLYNLDDPHPEAGFKAYFSKIRYEGQTEASWKWQSTGGSDEAEPKLSMMPLIWGSLKGTFYALFFALPIGVLSAAYNSQFLKPELRKYIKPAMEIMASLPSVVLGFLGALWLAPLVEDRMPSVFLTILIVPSLSFFIGWAWTKMPIQYRVFIKPGWEFLAFLPILLIASWASWQMGPALEKLLFVVTNPETGSQIADFRLWWPEVTGTPFEQRNSLIVGFIMGFAVIPIIFTITDDAMSNVPRSLTSASLALGASRWQTTARVVLPSASAGIFSALMIAFGRAVGETMIVVMATGNTPIMKINPFDGFRALSANIAVELPEAPQFSTLYRTLFLGALILFIFTFTVNTLAEVLRTRLRERYKTVG